MEKMVSLIIPCYNGERYLDTSFKCILEQTYSTVEVIFVNDGSEDASEKKFEQYRPLLEKKGYIVKYFFQDNQGAAAAVNSALKLVEGEYIMLYDVDDILMPEAIETKAIFLKNNLEYAMVRNNGYYVKGSKINSNAYLFVQRRNEKRSEWIFEDLLYGKTNNWSGTFMIRSSMLFNILDNKSIYISQYGQNLQVMLPVSYYYKTGFIDKALMRYVDFGSSHSRTKSVERQWELISGFERNRIAIINNMKISKEEKKKYTKNIKIFYNHIKLDYARQVGNKDILFEQYNILKNKDAITIKDRIIFICGKYKNWNRVYSSIIYMRGIAKAVIQRIEGIFRYDIGN